MGLGARTFRIFVSSTFADLKEERNALQERVFPRLQAFCLERGTRFQAIDLRWGVSAEAALDQQTMNICLDEVKRCQHVSPRPNFIVLLGDRYGWQPPTPQIPAGDFDEIVRRIPDADARALLHEWYVLDENACPPERRLRPRDGDYRNDDTWAPVERRLRGALEGAVSDMPLEVADRRVYETSATEQEIQRGALTSLPDHVFCYLRAIDFGSGGVDAHHDLIGDFVDLDATGERDTVTAHRLEHLKDELRGLPAGNVHDYSARWTGTTPVPITTDHIDDLCNEVYEDLARIILQELDRLEGSDALDREAAAHAEFGAERARFFTGRGDVLDRISSYIERSEGLPLVLHGPGGSGKSALMGRMAQGVAKRHPGSVVLRFVGATPDSSSGRALLEGLCREISRRFDGDENTVPGAYRDLARDLPERLALATEARPLVVVLDALDQLSEADEARSLSWLPSALPPHARLVVSTLSGESLRPLEDRVPASNLLELLPMSVDEAAELLDLWLQDADRTLQPFQREAILRQFSVEGLPLWLRLAAMDALRWKSTDTDVELPTTIPAIIEERLLDRLGDEANHGEVLVSRSFGYLAAAKNGLSEDEIIDALSLGGGDGPVLSDFRRRSPKSPPVERLPTILWSRLYFDLAPYLTERSADGSSLLGFYHRQLAEAAAERYLAGDEGLARHRELAAYFGGQDLTVGADGERTPNLRKMAELPYQLTMGERWNELFATLTDFEFLEGKATHYGTITTTEGEGGPVTTHTGIYQIRDDFALALDRMSGGTGAAPGSRPIVVTAVDFGEGLLLRCPHCRTAQALRDEWKGEEIECPNAACHGRLQVNPFVVGRPSEAGG